MWTSSPSKKQNEILNFIKNFQNNNNYSPSLGEIAKDFKVSIPTIHQHIDALEKKGLLGKTKNKGRSIEIYSNSKNEITKIPLLGIIPAGGPIEPIEDPQMLSIPQNMLSKSGVHYALKVRGESMIEEGIFDGDIIILRAQPLVENGENAAVYLPDKNTVTLKKIYREGRKIKLVPANKTMQPFYEDNVEIQGKVIGILRKF